MNFLELQKEVQGLVSDTSSASLVYIKSDIEDAIRNILNKGYWKFAIRQATITTTSGIQGYYMPSDLDKVISITQRDDKLQLQRIWVGDFDRLVPDPTQYTGRPKFYMELLDDRILAQPTTSSLVTAVSNSNSDLTQKITVWGTSGGVERSEVISLSAQNFISSVNTFSKVYALTLNLSCAGTVACYEGNVGTSLLKLYPGETEREYKKFNVFPIPDGTYTLYLTYQAGQIKLINDSDSLIIPSRYHQVIKDIATGAFLMRQGDQKASYYIQVGNQGIKDMLVSEEMLWDYMPTVRLADSCVPYNPNNPFYI